MDDRLARARRAWDVAVAVATVLLAVLIALAFPPGAVRDVWMLGGSVVAILIAYVLFARGRIERDEPGWQAVVFVIVASSALGIGIAAGPGLAMAQTFVYPLVWVIMRTSAQAIAGSIVVAAAVFTGTAAATGFAPEGIASGALTGAFSLLVSIVLGLWISSIARHAEERGRLEAQLASTREQLDALSRAQGASAERERLAREIHDTLAQTLAGLVILAERAGRQSAAGDPDGAADTIRTVEQAAREALGEARGLVARTAAVPGEAALDAAVGRLVHRFRTETGLAIELEVSGSDREIDRDAQVVLLRCLQEALANVRKHARATLVRVAVAVAADEARVTVIDDGRGFDPSAPRHGFGLDGMADRLALADGALEIVTAPGDGTALTATVRLRGAAEAHDLPGPAVPPKNEVPA